MTLWWREVVHTRHFIPLSAKPDPVDRLAAAEAGFSMGKPLRAAYWTTMNNRELVTGDYSGFVVLVRDDLLDDVAYLLTWCLVETRDAIEQQYRHMEPERSPLNHPLDPVKMVDSPVPLHDGRGGVISGLGN